MQPPSPFSKTHAIPTAVAIIPIYREIAITIHDLVDVLLPRTRVIRQRRL